MPCGSQARKQSVSVMATHASTDHFERFGMPRSFDMDLGMLDSRYRELQRTVHPDRFASAGEAERRLSMQQATTINEGYQTLKDPMRRGRYLLELSGYNPGDEPHTTRDTAFLMEQMALREALGEVRGSSDPFAALEIIMDRIAADIVTLQAQLRENFERASVADLEAAATALMKMQFYRRLQEEVMDLQAALEDELV
jgi:molecular chaperone HscB